MPQLQRHFCERQIKSGKNEIYYTGSRKKNDDDDKKTRKILE